MGYGVTDPNTGRVLWGAILLHWERKLFHFSGVVIPVLYLGAGLGRTWVWGILAAITGCLLALDLLRRFVPGVQERFERRLRLLLDPKDLRGLNGSTLYFGGCALTVALFGPETAGAGLLALVVGDPAAALVGSSVRSPRIGRVSLAGSAACFAGAAAACALVVPWPRALAAGCAAAALEAVAGSKLDNLVIPVGVAGCLGVL
ncbi:MAG: hypothetical protein ACE5JG_05875 [Planctomycetota bacterium]